MELDLREIPVYYINMKEDVVKRERMEYLGKSAGFKNFNRVEGIRLPIPAGCAASHLSVMKDKKPPFIILEDDCVIKSFIPEISIPDDTDALYLGISSWGRLDSHSGEYVLTSQVNSGFLRVYNMLGTHAMLFLSERYVSACKAIADYSMQLPAHLDVGYAEVQKYYTIYAFDDPMFFQTSSGGTDKPLTSYNGFHSKDWCWVKGDKHGWLSRSPNHQPPKMPSIVGYVRHPSSKK
mgnify:CR=1 FL=1|tara:strand:- start:1653 stop:2360 length:708 start_codon:yes stop_codon:yes gene_type:complete